MGCKLWVFVLLLIYVVVNVEGGVDVMVLI